MYVCRGLYLIPFDLLQKLAHIGGTPGFATQSSISLIGS